MLFYAAFAVLVCATYTAAQSQYIEGQQGFQQSWVKLSEHEVCFEGTHERYGSFNNYVRKGMVTAIKLEYVSGQIRCIGGIEYNSRWGCNGYAPFAQYPLNVVVTDRYNHVLFPKKDYIVNTAGLWYWLPFVSVTSSDELIFTDYAQPFFFPKDEEMRIWYGEDLKNWADADDVGRVCVNVYAKFMP